MCTHKSSAIGCSSFLSLYCLEHNAQCSWINRPAQLYTYHRSPEPPRAKPYEQQRNRIGRLKRITGLVYGIAHLFDRENEARMRAFQHLARNISDNQNRFQIPTTLDT